MSNQQPTLWDHSAEAAVLGGVLFDEQCLADAAAILEPGDFHFKPHGDVFAAAQRLRAADTPIDVVTLSDATRDQGHTSLVGEIAVNAYTAANVPAHAHIVREHAQRRAVIRLCQSAIKNAGQQPIADVIADLGARLEGTANRVIGSDTTWHAAVTRTMAALDKAAMRGDDEIPGVRTHFRTIDGALGGLCEGRLVVLAARPGAGKTALSNQIGFTAGHDGVPVGIISLEMGEAELVERAWAMRYGANFTRLQKARSDALSTVVRGCERDGGLQNLPIWLDEDAFDLTSIEARVTAWVRSHGVRVVVIDHLQLIDLPGRLTPNERVGTVTKRLKRLAKRLGIAVLLLCQLNRNGEREGRRPTMADLRDSGSIEQDADAILALHADADDLSREPRPTWLGILKNRTGRTGWPNEPLQFEGRFQRFTDSGGWS